MSDENKDKLENLEITAEEAGINIDVDSPSDIAPTEEEFAKAKKIMTDNDEIAAFNKEVLCQLESPLVVHNKSDASYEKMASSVEMNDTHIDEERPTLVRHRFKRDEKKKNRGIVPIFLVVVITAVFCALYFTGNLPFGKEPQTTVAKETTTESTTVIQDLYKGKIVIKSTYIFVDGYEVNGIKGLMKELKYVDPSPNAYEIVIEGTNEDFDDVFYNDEIYPILQDMGFIDETTVVTHIAKSGLIAEDETTTLPTTKKEKTTKKNSEKTTKKTTEKSNDNE